VREPALLLEAALALWRREPIMNSSLKVPLEVLDTFDFGVLGPASDCKSSALPACLEDMLGDLGGVFPPQPPLGVALLVCELRPNARL
jgi:hypothetical protein